MHLLDRLSKDQLVSLQRVPQDPARNFNLETILPRVFICLSDPEPSKSHKFVQDAARGRFTDNN